MANNYTDMLRSLLGGIGSATNDTTGTWQGIERSTEVPFRSLSARIQLSGAAIAASRQQEEAFMRAAHEEWAAIENTRLQYERNIMYYMQGQQWVKFYGDSWDPDMEMDIGL